MYLAIAKHTGFFYERQGGNFAPIVPPPLLSHACLIEQQSDWKMLRAHLRFEGQSRLVFREDQFDPVTRTRRGRLYSGYGGQQPSTEYAYRHPYEVPHAGLINTAGDRKEMYVYSAPPALTTKAHSLHGKTLAIGSSEYATTWRIIQVEIVGMGDLLVTLKSLATFGIVPDLDTAAVPSDSIVHVQQALERVLASAFRETAISVIDNCRAALTVLISHWLVARGEPATVLTHDLGKLCDALTRHSLEAAAASARIVARLHARGKPNVQQQHAISIPVEEDAALTLHVVGFVMRELRWARTSVA